MRASHKLEELQTHFDTTAHLSYLTSCCSPQSPKTAATVAASTLLMPAKLYHTPGHLRLLSHTLAAWLNPLFLYLMHKDTPPHTKSSCCNSLPIQLSLPKNTFYIYLNIYYIPY